MRAFISYSHTDRQYGAQAKAVLADVGIDAFLAHDDIEVSEEWRARILDELRSCGLFVPLLSAQFMTSKWAPQEAGFIVSRPEVVIAPLSIDGTVPFGFIGHVQASRIPPTGITRELLVLPLARRQPREILPRLIQVAVGARSFRDAEAKMRPLVPFFGDLSPAEAQSLAEGSVENGQIWDASLCQTEYLPQLIRSQQDSIHPRTLRALQYQIDHARWYPGDDTGEA